MCSVDKKIGSSFDAIRGNEMTPPIAKSAGVVLLAAPEKQGRAVVKAFKKTSLECLRAADAESCVALVQNVQPAAILIDLDLRPEDCRRIIAKMAEMVEARTVPVILLAQVADLDFIKTHLLSSVQEIVFKPIRPEELICRIDLINEKRRKTGTCRLDEAGRQIVLSARKACHELNQPLQYIMGSVQLSLMDLTAEDPIYETMSGLRQQSERMAMIASDLMHLIRSIG